MSLSGKSPFYFENTELYKRFSETEDFQGKIVSLLGPILKDKVVLDVGCGSGKYLKLFAPYAKKMIGIDHSPYQIEHAKKQTKNLKNTQAMEEKAEALPFAEKEFDIIFASWVLGTIPQKRVQKKAVLEMKRVLKKGGTLLLVENDSKGSFEWIRGRATNGSGPTNDYNRWLIEKNDFVIHKKMKTCFQFESLKEAKRVFGGIWGDSAAKKIKKSHIAHDLIILKYVKID